MFPCVSYNFHMTENEVAYLNWQQSHCAVVKVSEVELIERFPKESITTDGGEEVQGLSECCIVLLFLESYQPMSVESDFHR